MRALSTCPAPWGLGSTANVLVTSTRCGLSVRPAAIPDNLDSWTPEDVPSPLKIQMPKPSWKPWSHRKVCFEYPLQSFRQKSTEKPQMMRVRCLLFSFLFLPYGSICLRGWVPLEGLSASGGLSGMESPSLKEKEGSWGPKSPRGGSSPEAQGIRQTRHLRPRTSRPHAKGQVLQASAPRFGDSLRAVS